MRTALLIAPLAAAAVLTMTAPAALAQRGTGEDVGIARSGVAPEIVTLQGTLTEVKTGPCEATTGRSPVGTHLLLTTDDGQTLNLHLGPAPAVAPTVARLPVGEALTVEAFTTDKLKDNHYIVRAIILGEERIELRDASLRPRWAAGNTAPRAGRGFYGAAACPCPYYEQCQGQCPAPGYGRGMGMGRGMGWGGQGAGPGFGRGMGYGRGMGMGPGMGQCPAPGYGRGMGQGRFAR